jgi:hypothetical protein
VEEIIELLNKHKVKFHLIEMGEQKVIYKVGKMSQKVKGKLNELIDKHGIKRLSE